MDEYRQLIMAGLAAALSAALMGKTLKRLILLPFKLLASKTKTREDDVIVAEAARDMGLDPTAATPLDTQHLPQPNNDK